MKLLLQTSQPSVRLLLPHTVKLPKRSLVSFMLSFKVRSYGRNTRRPYRPRKMTLAPLCSLIPTMLSDPIIAAGSSTATLHVLIKTVVAS